MQKEEQAGERTKAGICDLWRLSKAGVSLRLCDECCDSSAPNPPSFKGLAHGMLSSKSSRCDRRGGWRGTFSTCLSY
eukprot:1721093-Rhodomonas_salina.1